MQDPKNLTITLINERFIKMIDNTVVQYQDGEIQAEGPHDLREDAGSILEEQCNGAPCIPEKGRREQDINGIP